VKERPILYRAPMVRAILRDEKTQTRRRVKPRRREDAGLAGPCPYGVPGDRLWVKETFRFGEGGLAREFVHYRADEDEPPAPGQWKPSIFMPRHASRITLEVTAVRVQRVQDIDEVDAIAEGVASRAEYARLWCDINGATSWDENPFVWAVSFVVLKGGAK